MQSIFLYAVAAGASGVATAQVTSDPISGSVQGICVQFVGANEALASVVVEAIRQSDFPAPADPIAELGFGVFDQLIYGQRLGTHNDGWYYPRVPVHTVGKDDATGTITTQKFATGGEPVVEAIPVDGNIRLTIANCNAGDYARIWIILSD